MASTVKEKLKLHELTCAIRGIRKDLQRCLEALDCIENYVAKGKFKRYIVAMDDFSTALYYINSSIQHALPKAVIRLLPFKIQKTSIFKPQK